MSSKAFFVSDIHLHSEASPNGEALLSLLAQAYADPECKLFVVLGDLFDWWMGSGDAFVSRFPLIIKAFEKLKNRGCEIIYFEGNHDIHIKGFWRDRIGARVITERYTTQFDGLTIKMEHGDLINHEEKSYLLLRWFLRTPLLTALVDICPSSWTQKIGDRSSKASRKKSVRYHNDPKIRDRVRDYAEKSHQVEKFDFLLTGHTHMQDDYIFERDGKKIHSINLGSWYDGPHYLKIEDKKASFEKI